jgi:hypothetical protein
MRYARRISENRSSAFLSGSVLLAWGLALCADAAALECVDKDAMPEAKAILEYFHGLKKNGQKNRVVSGNTLGPAVGDQHRFDAGNRYYELKVWAEQVSGRFPAIVCGWPDMYSRKYWTKVNEGQIDYGFNRLLIEHWKKGGLVMIEPQFANPYGALDAKRSSSRKSKMTDAEFAALTDPTKPVHKVFLRQLDAHAKGLKELADAGVVVLYHPHVEGWGGHFWWGRKGKHFVKFWRYQVDYFTKQKGLHNLLWVCDALGNSWPGDRYVDIDAPHMYGHGGPNTPLWRAWSSKIRRGSMQKPRHPHPLIIGEMGARINQVDWDAAQMLSVLKRLPHVVGYQNWCAPGLSLVGAKNTYKLVNDPLILNRGELTVRGGKPHEAPAVLPDRSHILKAWEWYYGWPTNFARSVRKGDGWSELAPMKKRLHQGGSAIIGNVGGPGAGFQSPGKIGVQVGPNVGVQISIINRTDAETLVVEFTTEKDAKWDEAKRLTCTINANDEFDVYDQKYHVYRLTGKDVPGWTGTLKQFRIRLGPKAKEGSLRIDHVRIVDLAQAPAVRPANADD